MTNYNTNKPCELSIGTGKFKDEEHQVIVDAVIVALENSDGYKLAVINSMADARRVSDMLLSTAKSVFYKGGPA